MRNRGASRFHGTLISTLKTQQCVATQGRDASIFQLRPNVRPNNRLSDQTPEYGAV